MSVKDYLYDLATDRARGFWAGIFKAILLVLSFFYCFIIILLRAFLSLRPRRFSSKVISIGNITLGGTGKTVLVEKVARFLKDRGHKVAILTRGYKRQDSCCSASRAEYKSMGDEAFMLRKSLKDVPVIVDPDRIRGATAAISKYEADVMVLDDGFQQWRIRKDLEIVTVDSIMGFANRTMLPRGILREPVSSLKRADVFVITNADSVKDAHAIKRDLTSINNKALILESVHRPVGFYELGKEALMDKDAFSQKTVSVVCGIGNPQSFKNTLRKCNVNIGAFFEFPDHYDFSQKDLKVIEEASLGKGACGVIITEKDSVRMAGLDTKGLKTRIYVLKIEMEIKENEKEFHDRLLGVFSA